MSSDEEGHGISGRVSERPGVCNNEAKMDTSPKLSNRTTNDPYRQGQSVVHEETKEKNCTESDLRKRLDIVENELVRSKSEVLKLRNELAEANHERKEILRTVSSLHVQIQYWNSWFGNLSQNLSGMKAKFVGSEGDHSKNNEDSLRESSNDKSTDMVDCTKDVTVDNRTISNDSGVDNRTISNDSGVDNRTISNGSGVGFDSSINGGEEKVSEVKHSVADMLKETAESAFADYGMAYDDNSGLYYDWNSHMYYDPNTHLFYDNDNGIYYYYDHTKGSYVFYSQVNVKPTNDISLVSPLSAESKSEGEISSSESEVELEMASCVRAIVAASGAVKVGTLYLVTCSGATIGRDKEQRLHLPDKDASKVHAVIKYEENDSRYFVKDCGSVNGTFLNGKRLGESRVEGEWFPVNHKDFLKIGSTVFVLHVHKGQETCDDCEPGQVQALLSSLDYNCLKTTYDNLSKEELRKKQLRGLKEKYMVSGDGLKQALEPMTSGKYKDRANKRRKNIGSEPIKDALRPQIEGKASVRKMISVENKGHQMMQKMGWKFGEGLGKEKSGIKEPINAVIREKNKGLGSGALQLIGDSPGQKKLNQKWKKAKQRYDDIIQDEKDINYGANDKQNSEFDF